MNTTIDVLVVDDSLLMQRLITHLLESDPRIRVVSTAANGHEAIEKVQALHPDVVTLDIEMPRMDGLEALQQIMQRAPTPVVMLSGVQEAAAAVRSLELGAVEFVAKPSGTISVDLYKVRNELIRKVKLATLVNLDRAAAIKTGPLIPLTAPARHPAPGRPWMLAIGASTGGPQALGRVLRCLPAELPAGVLIVQHMPAGFTASFAQRLNQRSPLPVEEARDGQKVMTGSAYVAPGGIHMVVVEERGHPIIRLQDTPPVNSVRPSADVLMGSVARMNGARSMGVVLTGMGADGAEGLAQIKAAGGLTLAQDKASSTIFGMPRAAIERGVVDGVLSLSKIPRAIVTAMQESKVQERGYHD
ncbi:MAG: chemotaxis response regulator protein-glutamate methylesterase [Chloroflexota bacterium]|nr:chemotaxis response regulator protein-glutamate methylesterase [Chloroflexota bacterium]